MITVYRDQITPPQRRRMPRCNERMTPKRRDWIATIVFVVAGAASFSLTFLSGQGFWPSSLVGLAAGTAGGSLIRKLFTTEERLRQAEEDPAEVLRRRIQEVNLAFSAAVTLKDDLERELQRQLAELEGIINRSEEHEVLLAQDAERAEALRRAITRKTKQEIRAERRQQLLYVAIGAVISFPIGLLVNWIS
ncbi:hypothetical protein [Nonomuraea sediminis]|uniref:hypothetical protein n=1 Tax=Nonomuraea sediminis TaxID=2835864 RepID=UPI001BDCA12D|nr:hypothetical protein [Nonomuraea sediminis]